MIANDNTGEEIEEDVKQEAVIDPELEQWF